RSRRWLTSWWDRDAIRRDGVRRAACRAQQARARAAWRESAWLASFPCRSAERTRAITARWWAGAAHATSARGAPARKRERSCRHRFSDWRIVTARGRDLDVHQG